MAKFVDICFHSYEALEAHKNMVEIHTDKDDASRHAILMVPVDNPLLKARVIDMSSSMAGAKTPLYELHEPHERATTTLPRTATHASRVVPHHNMQDCIILAHQGKIHVRASNLKWLPHPNSRDHLYTPDFDVDGWHPLREVGGPVIGVVNQHESRGVLPKDALIIEYDCVAKDNHQLIFIRHFVHRVPGSTIAAADVYEMFKEWFKRSYPGKRIQGFDRFTELLCEEGYKDDGKGWIDNAFVSYYFG